MNNCLRLFIKRKAKFCWEGGSTAVTPVESHMTQWAARSALLLNNSQAGQFNENSRSLTKAGICQGLTFSFWVQTLSSHCWGTTPAQPWLFLHSQDSEMCYVAARPQSEQQAFSLILTCLPQSQSIWSTQQCLKNHITWHQMSQIHSMGPRDMGGAPTTWRSAMKACCWQIVETND